MEFKKAVNEDVIGIMDIIKQAQEYFRENNIDQWQDNYPNEGIILEDIKKSGSYVLIKDNKIIATVAILFEEDEFYKDIYEGKWISNDKYAVVHRIAVAMNNKGEGIASDILKQVEKFCIKKGVYSIKIDTHEENKSMQRLLVKNGFEYCGIIYVRDKSKRVAFEKVLGDIK